MGDRMIALFLLGAVALGPPALGLAAGPVFILGIPLLFAWLFGVWAAVIGLLALAIARREAAARADPDLDG